MVSYWLIHNSSLILLSWAVCCSIASLMYLDSCLSHIALMKSNKWCSNTASCTPSGLLPPSFPPTHSHWADRQLHLIFSLKLALKCKELCHFQTCVKCQTYGQCSRKQLKCSIGAGTLRVYFHFMLLFSTTFQSDNVLFYSFNAIALVTFHINNHKQSL